MGNANLNEWSALEAISAFKIFLCVFLAVCSENIVTPYLNTLFQTVLKIQESQDRLLVQNYVEPSQTHLQLHAVLGKSRASYEQSMIITPKNYDASYAAC